MFVDRNRAGGKRFASRPALFYGSGLSLSLLERPLGQQERVRLGQLDTGSPGAGLGFSVVGMSHQRVSQIVRS
jgi:hypothetical protein